MSGTPKDGSDRADAEPVTRYAFGSFLGDGWGVWRQAPLTWLGTFIPLHVVAALIPFLIFFDIPDEGTLAVAFFVRVASPVIAGSIAVALAVRLTQPAARREGDESSDGEAEPGVAWPEVVALAFFASLLAVVLVLFLGAYGFLIVHVVYGPPLAVQAMLLEGLPLRDSLRKARALLKGNLRMLLYLVTLAIVVGLVSFVVIGGLYTAAENASDVVEALILSVGLAVVVGTLTSIYGAAQTGLYLHLSSEKSRLRDAAIATKANASRD